MPKTSLLPRKSQKRLQEAPAKVRRILIVDDHPIFRHGMAALISSAPDLQVCGEADSASTALEKMRELDPDVVLMDISLPGTNGIELVKLMVAEKPKLPILMLSMHDESLYALRALRAGALGYVMKAEALTHVIEALRKVLGGELYVSSQFKEQLIFKAIHSKTGDAASPVEALSDRELEVLTLVGRGYSTRRIATELHLSVKTIETHRAHIKEKLGLKDSGDVVRFATEWVEHGRK